MVSLIVLSAFAGGGPPHELYDYLARKDSSFKFSFKDRSKGEIEMVSQTWQGIPWKHTILMRQPSKLQTKGTAILYITGDGPFKGDYQDLALVTEATGMPTAMLFSVPNQPIFGKKEDDLIAYTFDKYLTTHDPTWPLLFPMTKSALRAMDAVVALTKDSPNPIHNFVVTGASKRGWTTWFVGASKDPRVKGIAPMVIDNLNVARQMKHQIETWGTYSDEIKDYTRRGLQQKLATPAGRHLAEIIDPYSYRSNIKVPTLVVKGSNDPYWTVDALSQYWDGLREPKWIVNVPNADHGLGNKLEAVESIGAFARSIAGSFKMPKEKWSIVESSKSPRTLTVNLRSSAPSVAKLTVWLATSDSLDFRSSKYVEAAVLTVNGGNSSPSNSTAIVSAPADKNVAVFLEARYRVGTRRFDLCSPTKVFVRHDALAGK